jgi:hypothetical protein
MSRAFHVLIDDRGRRWNPQGQDFAAHLANHDVGFDRVQYAIENLGWVELALSEKHLRIRCRPKVVSSGASAAAYYAVYDCRPGSVTLTVLGDTWSDHIHCRTEDVIGIMTGMGSGGVCIDALSLPALHQVECDPKASLLAPAAQEISGANLASKSLDEAETLISAVVGGRWSLSEFDQVSGETVTVACGSGFTRYNPNWSARPVGQSLVSYADGGYGSWVSRHRREVAQRGEPVFDDVDAVVRFPQIGKVRMLYSRVTMPVMLSDGRSLVLSAARLGGADLRVLARVAS